MPTSDSPATTPVMATLTAVPGVALEKRSELRAVGRKTDESHGRGLLNGEPRDATGADGAHRRHRACS